MATKMKMVKKGGKMVPAFAADGKGKMKMGGKVKKMQDGGVTRQDIKQAKMQAKLNRINAGTEPSGYDKVSNIAGSVAKTATAAAESAKAVRDVKQGMGTGMGPGRMKKGGAIKLKKAMSGMSMEPMMKKGGAMKKMQDGGNSMYTNTTAGQRPTMMKKGGMAKAKMTIKKKK